MNSKIEKLVNQWAIEDSDTIYRTINSQLNFLSEALFHDYEPEQGANPDFRSRLQNWLANVDGPDKKTLFKLLPHIFYLGNKEYNNLLRVAYNEIIARWIIDNDNIKLDDFSIAQQALKNSITRCWICPITDSMDINSFYHINNVPGSIDWRPQWYNVNEPWNTMSQGLVNYINNEGLEKLVLLEDFVGSGSQIEQTIHHIMALNLGIPVLLLPIMNCPAGVNRFNNLQSQYPDLTYKSVLELSKQCFVFPVPYQDELPAIQNTRELIQRVYLKTSNGVSVGNGKPYSPFGYRDTGGLLVKYSNTPDNSIPVIHHESNTWAPLFRRHSRN
jgi:hypothetical protein